MFDTLAMFQLAMFWLKADAEANICERTPRVQSAVKMHVGHTCKGGIAVRSASSFGCTSRCGSAGVHVMCSSVRWHDQRLRQRWRSDTCSRHEERGKPCQPSGQMQSPQRRLDARTTPPLPKAISPPRMHDGKGITLLMFETVAMFQLATSALKAVVDANICEQTLINRLKAPLSCMHCANEGDSTVCQNGQAIKGNDEVQATVRTRQPTQQRCQSGCKLRRHCAKLLRTPPYSNGQRKQCSGPDQGIKARPSARRKLQRGPSSRSSNDAMIYGAKATNEWHNAAVNHEPKHATQSPLHECKKTSRRLDDHEHASAKGHTEEMSKTRAVFQLAMFWLKVDVE